MTMVKKAVTLDADIVDRALDVAPEGNFSAYVNDAVSEKIARDDQTIRLRALLDRDEAERGTIDPDEVHHAAAAVRALDA
jgi:hypothetical protein